MKFLTTLFVLCTFFSTSFAQDEKTPLQDFVSRATILSDAEIFDVKMSKDGQTVFFRKKNENKLIYYRQPQLHSFEKSIKFEANVKDYQPDFNNKIVVIAEANNRVKIYHANLSRAKDITPFEAQNAEILAFSEKLNTKVAVNFTDEDITKHGVFLVDLPGGKPRRVGLMGKFDAWYFDGLLQLTAGKIKGEKGGIALQYKKAGKWETIQDYPADMGGSLGGYQDVVSVSVDGKTIFYTDNFEKDKAVLMSFNIESGNKKELAADEVTDLLSKTALVDKTGKPQMIAGVFADARPVYLNSAVENDMLWLEKELAGKPSLMQQSTEGSHWLLAELTGGPRVYYLFDRKAKKVSRLFSSHPELDAFEVASRTTHRVTTRDAMQLPVHVYLPAGADSDGDGVPDQALPTVMFVHEGPWHGVSHWDSWAITRNFQLLADRGYAVINTEFRGSTGLGKSFTDAGNKQWGNKMRLDLEDIARWAVKEGIAAKNKTALMGASYGGYAAMAAAGMSDEQFACTIAMSGISDLKSYMESSVLSNMWHERVADPTTDEGQGLLSRYSPIEYVKDVKVPVLLTAGSQDSQVNQEQSDTFADALDAAGKEVVYFYYPEEGHDFEQKDTWISFWTIVEQFLAKNLEGKAAPAGEDLEKGFYDVMYGADFIDSIE